MGICSIYYNEFVSNQSYANIRRVLYYPNQKNFFIVLIALFPIPNLNVFFRILFNKIFSILISRPSKKI